MLSRKQLALPPNLWWARATVAGGYGYLFADNADLARWPSWLKQVAGDDLAEYHDFSGGVYRAASFVGERIETCLQKCCRLLRAAPADRLPAGAQPP